MMVGIGDVVRYRGDFGMGDQRVATIQNIEVCEYGEKYGYKVDEIDEFELKNGNVLVDLDDERWCYGRQIDEVIQSEAKLTDIC